jgi:hypothetical protein
LRFAPPASRALPGIELPDRRGGARFSRDPEWFRPSNERQWTLPSTGSPRLYCKCFPSNELQRAAARKILRIPTCIWSYTGWNTQLVATGSQHQVEGKRAAPTARAASRLEPCRLCDSRRRDGRLFPNGRCVHSCFRCRSVTCPGTHVDSRRRSPPPGRLRRSGVPSYGTVRRHSRQQIQCRFVWIAFVLPPDANRR